MFGYINVYRDELKIKDYNLFKAYYCGLCKALGKRYSQLVRLGLSYDMTFLAIIADAVCDEEPTFKKEGCIKHVGSRPVCVGNRAIDYSADMSIILAYHKLCDDIADEHSIKAFLARLAYIRPYKKACRNNGETAKKTREYLEKLKVCENDRCAMTDLAADPFASLLQEIFADFHPSLGPIGYNIGRFIYIADAYRDIDDDIKSGAYNPFVCSCKDTQALKTDEFRKRVMGSLNMTLSALCDAYRHLEIKRNKPILDNIIYMGLRSVYEDLFKTEEKNERSL